MSNFDIIVLGSMVLGAMLDLPLGHSQLGFKTAIVEKEFLLEGFV